MITLNATQINQTVLKLINVVKCFKKCRMSNNFLEADGNKHGCNYKPPPQRQMPPLPSVIGVFLLHCLYPSWQVKSTFAMHAESDKHGTSGMHSQSPVEKSHDPCLPSPQNPRSRLHIKSERQDCTWQTPCPDPIAAQPYPSGQEASPPPPHSARQ